MCQNTTPEYREDCLFAWKAAIKDVFGEKKETPPRRSLGEFVKEERMAEHKRRLEEAREQVPLGIYRHYKGGIYEVLGHGIDADTGEVMVYYQGKTSNRTHWVRSLHKWKERAGDKVRYELLGTLEVK